MRQRLNRFLNHVGAARVEDVIELLDKLAAPLRLLAIYPMHVLDHPGIDHHTVFGRAITPQLQQQLADAIAQNGASPLAYYAWRRPPPVPFTFSHAARHLNLHESEKWLIELIKRHGWRDGYYIPVSGWMVVYVSKIALRGLTLRQETRDVIIGAAAVAGARLTKVTRSKTKPVSLSKREQAVLRHLAAGHERVDLQSLLRPNKPLSKGTVQKYVERLIEKLSAENQTQAIAIALRDRLI